MLFSMLFASQLATAVASPSARSTNPGINVQGGDQATDPDPALTTQAPSGVAAQQSSSSFSDVPSGFWAGTAINTVAGSKTWMRDYGAKTFKPDNLETRELWAKAVVQAFDPNGKPDPQLHFADVDPDRKSTRLNSSH